MKDFIEIPANKNSLAKRKPLHGFAINDADYITTRDGVACPYYQRWRNMLMRCYTAKYQESFPTYVGCSVVKDWLVFSNFKRWMKLQDWGGMELDKDLLIKGNKVYSPDTCIFVPQSLNSLLLDNKKIRGRWPVGVAFNKKTGIYSAKCSVKGKTTYISCHSTAEEASDSYQAFKYSHIKLVAQNYRTNKRLYEALINYYE